VRTSQLLKAEHQRLSARAVLPLPIDALAGVSIKAATALNGILIKTVFDLVSWRLFPQRYLDVALVVNHVDYDVSFLPITDDQLGGRYAQALCGEPDR
jgi:hypothetical protein